MPLAVITPAAAGSLTPMGLPWGPAHAAATLADGTVVTTHGGTHAVLPDGTHQVTVHGKVTLVWQVRAVDQAFYVTLAVENPHPYDVALQRLDPWVVPAGLGPERLLQAGYQSWSHATPLTPVAQHHRPSTPPVGFPLLPPTEAERWVSSGMALVESQGHRLLVGFTAARVAQPYVAVAGARLVASCECEGLRLPAGGRFEAEPLVLLGDRPEAELLATYAELVAQENGARAKPHAPTGWCSWYYYFTAISEAAMHANLDVLDAHRADLPVAVVQLDDGYQTAIGDWLSVNAKFPSGLKALVEAIHARGYQAGIWLAPFFVGEHSRLYAEHPDWVVRDGRGLPIDCMTNWGTRNFALDTTHPGAQAYLREVFRMATEDWGFDYLKLDFLYGAALPGRRHDPEATGLQAYRLGMQLCREAAGERFILGCGAPLLASVGFVDGMRVGPDTAPDWRDPDPRGLSPAAENAIRSTLARHYMHGKWWVNDPDCLIVRAANSRLTEAEVRTWATVVALSGGMVLASDDLATLEPARAAILPRLLPPLGQAAVPEGPYQDGLPARLTLAVGDATLVALFNWADAPATLSCEAGDAHVFEVWDGRYLGQPGAVALETPPHGVQLLRLTPATGSPQLVGSTLTLFGGATEVLATRWAGDRLEVDLACPGRHVGELVVAIPPGFVPAAHQPAGAQVATDHLRLPLVLDTPLTLRFPFERAHP